MGFSGLRYAATPKSKSQFPVKGFQAPLIPTRNASQHPGPSQNRPGPIVSQADLMDGPKAGHGTAETSVKKQPLEVFDT
jgi:hypothetical protein